MNMCPIAMGMYNVSWGKKKMLAGLPDLCSVHYAVLLITP